MLNRIFLIGCVALVAFGGYTVWTRPKTPEARVIKQAYSAIESNDWESFQKLFVNRFELLARATAGSRFLESQTYSGAVLKPEEEERLKGVFHRLGAGESGSINFKDEKFVDVKFEGAEMDRVLIDLAGIEVQTKIYSVLTNQSSAGSQKRSPLFVLLDRPTGPKIMDLVPLSE